jgi:hypothetical protein
MDVGEAKVVPWRSRANPRENHGRFVQLVPRALMALVSSVLIEDRAARLEFFLGTLFVPAGLFFSVPCSFPHIRAVLRI